MRKRRRRKNRRERRLGMWIKAGVAVILILTVFFVLKRITGARAGKMHTIADSLNVDASMPSIDVQLLDVNEYSRPGTQIDAVKGIVVHYTANPGSTAQQNRDYFNSLKDGHDTSVSSHFVIGLEGEIIQCVPTWEIAYASNERNKDTVSIECCHPDETGQFTERTYESLVRLTAFLCKKYGLSENTILRHYDVTEKNCPKYFVEHEEAWRLFLEDVGTALNNSQ